MLISLLVQAIDNEVLSVKGAMPTDAYVPLTAAWRSDRSLLTTMAFTFMNMDI
jgi:hypothetical protein